MNQESKDYAFLHFLVLIWGLTSVLGMLIKLPSVELVFFRTLISSIALFLLVQFGEHSFRIRRGKDLLMVGFVGFLIAAHWILFFLAARVSNISICLAGIATCSLWTSLLEPLTSKKKVQPFEVLLSIVAFVGIGVIFRVEFHYMLGMGMAIVSAFLAAWFTVINANLIKRYDHFVLTFYQIGGACVVTALFFPIYSSQMVKGPLDLNPSWMDWVYLLILALLCTVFAYSYSVKLMRRLSAFAVNLSVNLEPVYGILLALLVFGEKEAMSSGFYVGTLLILLSVLAYPIINRAKKRKALETDLIR
ncbi:MAG: DMT family transporter [Cyclobacteriaceae bacterium]|nr:DMT family transporter [Cyclobacteriaceae bacterium HetDA_MAG_MS6]